MPWTCPTCNGLVAVDTVTRCPGCGHDKLSWSVDAGRTRQLVVPTRKRLECLRGVTLAVAPPGPPAARGVAWPETRRAAALPGALVKALLARGERPDPRHVLAVRLQPGAQGAWTLTVAVRFETRPVEPVTTTFARRPERLDEEGTFGAHLLCVHGPDVPGEGAFPDLWLLDVTDATERGVAPALEVSALGGKPVVVELDPVASAQRLEVLRGVSAHEPPTPPRLVTCTSDAPGPARDPYAGATWLPAEVGPVMPAGRARTLESDGRSPASRDVVCLRVESDAQDHRVRVVVNAEGQPPAEACLLADAPVPGRPTCRDLRLLLVAGSGPVPRLQDVRVLDVTDDTPRGVAPTLTVETPGAPARTLPLEGAPATRRARLRGLLFETDKAFLLPSAFPGLEALRGLYEAHPGAQVLVVGHADAAGAAEHNLDLSSHRAAAIAAFLRDDVELWLGWYGADRLPSQRWGVREDQHMLRRLADEAGPFYAGPLDGQAWAPATRAAVERFQRWSNARRGTSLVVDGLTGPLTRRALVGAYMASDRATLPPGTVLLTHGCGEFHPEVATADGVSQAENRRVEVFFFDGGIAPPPRPRCPAPGCPEHALWVEQAETVDLGAGRALTVSVTDDAQAPVGHAAVRLGGDALDREGETDDGGLSRFEEVAPGRYEVVVQKDGFASARREVTVGGGLALMFGGGGDGDEPPDRVPVVVRRAPRIVTFLAQPLPRSSEDGEPLDPDPGPPAPRAVAFAGRPVSLSWRIDGPCTRLVLRGEQTRVISGAELQALLPEGALEVDPCAFAPGEDRTYELVAERSEGDFYEPEVAASPPARVTVVGVFAFDLRAWRESEGGKDAVLVSSAKTGNVRKERPVEVLPGRPGSFEAATGPALEHGWWGQITPRPDVTFSWCVTWDRPCRLELVVDRGLSWNQPLLLDVTPRANAGSPSDLATLDIDPASIYEVAWRGRVHVRHTGKFRLLFQADLRLVDVETGAVATSAHLRLREAHDEPGIESLRVHDATTGRTTTIESWEALRVSWKLRGSAQRTRLRLTIRALDGALLHESWLKTSEDTRLARTDVAPDPTPAAPVPVDATVTVTLLGVSGDDPAAVGLSGERREEIRVGPVLPVGTLPSAGVPQAVIDAVLAPGPIASVHGSSDPMLTFPSGRVLFVQVGASDLPANPAVDDAYLAGEVIPPLQRYLRELSFGRFQLQAHVATATLPRALTSYIQFGRDGAPVWSLEGNGAFVRDVLANATADWPAILGPGVTDVPRSAVQLVILVPSPAVRFASVRETASWDPMQGTNGARGLPHLRLGRVTTLQHGDLTFDVVRHLTFAVKAPVEPDAAVEPIRSVPALAHELLHAFFHLPDRDAKSPATVPTGNYDLMGYRHGWLHVNAHDKFKIGFMQPRFVVPTTTRVALTFKPIAHEPDAVVVLPPSALADPTAFAKDPLKQYWVLEYRRREGTMDEDLGEAGLAVWHVQEGIRSDLHDDLRLVDASKPAAWPTTSLATTWPGNVPDPQLALFGLPNESPRTLYAASGPPGARVWSPTPIRFRTLGAPADVSTVELWTE